MIITHTLQHTPQLTHTHHGAQLLHTDAYSCCTKTRTAPHTSLTPNTLPALPTQLRNARTAAHVQCNGCEVPCTLCIAVLTHTVQHSC